MLSPADQLRLRRGHLAEQRKAVRRQIGLTILEAQCLAPCKEKRILQAGLEMIESSLDVLNGQEREVVAAARMWLVLCR